MLGCSWCRFVWGVDQAQRRHVFESLEQFVESRAAQTEESEGNLQDHVVLMGKVSVDAGCRPEVLKTLGLSNADIVSSHVRVDHVW